MPALGVIEQKIQDAQQARVVYTYPVPERMGGDVQSVGLVELTAEEELMATKRARNEGARLAYELTKLALREVNGQRVSTGDGSADSAWNRMKPKVRNLVLQAFADLHTPDDEDVSGFLKGCQAKV